MLIINDNQHNDMRIVTFLYVMLSLIMLNVFILHVESLSVMTPSVENFSAASITTTECTKYKQPVLPQQNVQNIYKLLALNVVYTLWYDWQLHLNWFLGQGNNR
jgi:hypothetical protein